MGIITGEEHVGLQKFYHDWHMFFLSLVVNDIDKAAVEAIDRNIASNGIDANECKGNLGDAAMVMYDHRALEKQFDVVDLVRV